MQHIASQDALRASKERLLEVAGPRDEAALRSLGEELLAVGQLLARELPLRRTLSEATTDADHRASLLRRVLDGKVSAPTLDVVDDVVRQPWASGADLRDGFLRLGRTAMFLQAERSGDLDEVEDELFRFARIVDASPDLSVILDDPGADPAGRATLVKQVLGDRSNQLTTDLLTGLAQYTGGRSYSHGVRELVDQAAERRDKIVAVVQSAITLSAEQDARLRAALQRIYRQDIAVHVLVQPELQGGMRIQVGDEVIDGSVAGRIDALRRSLAG